MMMRPSFILLYNMNTLIGPQRPHCIIECFVLCGQHVDGVGANGLCWGIRSKSLHAKARRHYLGPFDRCSIQTDFALPSRYAAHQWGSGIQTFLCVYVLSSEPIASQSISFLGALIRTTTTKMSAIFPQCTNIENGHQPPIAVFSYKYKSFR